jgi:peptide/nickel transport system ATP-binding protein
MSLLAVEDLSVRFDTDDGAVHAVDRLSFALDPGEVLGIVGESGCGKSVTAMSLLQLLPQTASVSGRAEFDGIDLLSASGARLRRIRGREIAFVFQEPMTSLNPSFRIGNQLGEVLRRHLGLGRAAARERAVELLDLVRIPVPERRVDEYPHQLSGGMRQRVMIAMALACDPKILIADEPTTALDVTIQAGILDLMRDIRSRLGTAIVLITHNLGVVADIADRVIVMYAGRKVEEAPVHELYAHPQHPYTIGLIRPSHLVACFHPGASGADESAVGSTEPLQGAEVPALPAPERE